MANSWSVFNYTNHTDYYRRNSGINSISLKLDGQSHDARISLMNSNIVVPSANFTEYYQPSTEETNLFDYCYPYANHTKGECNFTLSSQNDQNVNTMIAEYYVNHMAFPLTITGFSGVPGINLDDSILSILKEYTSYVPG